MKVKLLSFVLSVLSSSRDGSYCVLLVIQAVCLQYTNCDDAVVALCMEAIGACYEGCCSSVSNGFTDL